MNLVFGASLTRPPQVVTEHVIDVDLTAEEEKRFRHAFSFTLPAKPFPSDADWRHIQIRTVDRPDARRAPMTIWDNMRQHSVEPFSIPSHDVVREIIRGLPMDDAVKSQALGALDFYG